MGVKAKPDFSGYATKAGLRCADGRTITPDAFKHQDNETVPLVWMHGHSDPGNVLGHVVLEHRNDGEYCYAYFNSTEKGQTAKKLVQHEDVVALSIYANQLVEKGKKVLHGMIREVSLVLSGANPEALIDNINLAHADGDVEVLDDEAIIFTGLTISHSDDTGDEQAEETPEVEFEETPEVEDEETPEVEDEETPEVEHSDEPTIQEIYDGMDDQQKAVVHTLVGAAVENVKNDTAVTHSNDNNDEGTVMKRNVFESATGDKTVERYELSHSDMDEIVDKAKQMHSLREAVDSFALQHGIEDIDVLFPEYRSIEESPQFLARRVEWVTGVLNSVRHSPFTRIKSIVADITFPEARARGYVKGNMKKEEWLSVSKRKTTPATIYKKQKLDRDDIIDITDFDVVVWLKAEMRIMFDEELARAILIGDGRDTDDEDKVADPAGSNEGAGIRSILNDHDLYAVRATVDDTATGIEIVDAITEAMQNYKGSGAPIFYSTLPFITKLLTTRDEFNHRLWRTKEELAAEMGVAGIVTVEVMEDEADLIGIVVNLTDYTLGADKGGEVNFFDFFDIDYNQYKYLYESRLSGALTKVRSAIVIMRAATGGVLVAPEKPDFNGSDVTVPDTAHVVYRNGPTTSDDVVTDSVINLDPGEEVTIYATPASGYYFADNVHDQWTFRNAG